MTTIETMTAGRTCVGLHQRRKLFEMRNQYTLTDEAGQPIGAVEQVNQSPFHFLARLISDLDIAMPVTLDVTDSAGDLVLRLRKRWFRFTVHVTGGDGNALGRITKRIRLGKARFEVVGPDGGTLAWLRAENWRAKDFRLDGPSGDEVARVTKKWRGLLTEVATDADSYAVTFAPATADDLRALALASALAVDLTMKQKDYGSPIDLLTG